MKFVYINEGKGWVIFVCDLWFFIKFIFDRKVVVWSFVVFFFEIGRESFLELFIVCLICGSEDFVFVREDDVLVIFFLIYGFFMFEVSLVFFFL